MGNMPEVSQLGMGEKSLDLACSGPKVQPVGTCLWFQHAGLKIPNYLLWGGLRL